MDEREILSRIRGVEFEFLDEPRSMSRRWICVFVGCVPDDYDGQPIACACTGHCQEWYVLEDILDGTITVKKGNGEHLPPSMRRQDRLGKPKGWLP